MADANADLGQVLFEQKVGTIGCLGAMIGVGALMLAAGGLVLGGVVDLGRDVNLPTGAGLLVVGLAIGAWGAIGLRRGPQTITFFERGGRSVRKGITTTFMYDQAEDVGYGVQQGAKPIRNLRFRMPGADGVTEVSNFDPDAPSRPTAADVEALRDRMVLAAAKRLRERLAAGETVPWTENLRLSRKAVEANGQSLPWQQIDRAEADEATGEFELYAKGKSAPFAKEKMTAAGFLPGWQLFKAVRPKT